MFGNATKSVQMPFKLQIRAIEMVIPKENQGIGKPEVKFIITRGKH